MLLLDKVPLTNLERLGLDWKWIEKEALHEKLPEYLCKLKFLTFNGFRDLNTTIEHLFIENGQSSKEN
ncbi:hypothetical protein LWI28_004928 [Acer negundo]|uniref:Uncharacterized protein n=1 Tax=Acer negundo TaxID=4023 RepID=A0AAD5JIV8_ACENE|nr:hypothetical protein LWI28_004928 [Acer negundo]